MTQLILASNNVKKIAELRAILADLALDLEVVGLDVLPVVPPMVENGATFLENATIKAHAVAAVAPEAFVLADDSGLIVPALDGAPGVYSARYAGDHDDAANNAKLLAELADKTDRSAQFKSVLVLTGPNRSDLVAEGSVDGQIGRELVGDGGFGYDPLFIADETDLTFAQMTAAQKNTISHRGRALQNLAAALPAWLAQEA